MRIGLASAEYPPHPQSGGIGTYVATAARGFASEDHEVHVISCLPNQEPSDHQDGSVAVHRRGWIPVRGIGRLLRSPGAGARLMQALSCRRALDELGLDLDIVETPDYMAEGLFLPRRGRFRHVAHLHTPSILLDPCRAGPDWDGRLVDRLERRAVSRADAIVAPSQLVVDELRARGWYFRESPQVLPYPLDTEQYVDVCPVRESDELVLVVGRIGPLKGQRSVVQAMAHLATSEARLVLVGRSETGADGRPVIDALRRLADASGVRLEHVGAVPPTEVAEQYGRARVVVVPSMYDNFPFVGLEAMASGRPVVCSSTTGVARLVHQVEPAAVVPPGDTEALARAIEPHLEDPCHAASVGAQLRCAVRAECDLEVATQSRLRFYEEVLQRRDGFT